MVRANDDIFPLFGDKSLSAQSHSLSSSDYETEEGFSADTDDAPSGHVEEERRVLYVALSRAIESLTVSFISERPSQCGVSRFLLPAMRNGLMRHSYFNGSPSERFNSKHNTSQMTSVESHALTDCNMKVLSRTNLVKITAPVMTDGRVVVHRSKLKNTNTAVYAKSETNIEYSHTKGDRGSDITPTNACHRPMVPSLSDGVTRLDNQQVDMRHVHQFNGQPNLSQTEAQSHNSTCNSHTADEGFSAPVNGCGTTHSQSLTLSQSSASDRTWHAHDGRGVNLSMRSNVTGGASMIVTRATEQTETCDDYAKPEERSVLDKNIGVNKREDVTDVTDCAYQIISAEPHDTKRKNLALPKGFARASSLLRR